MVFESVVADLLNRVLGDYVENLDSKQLNIGIWGGDVVLKDLILKQNALDDLDLPVQTVYGKLGKLVLKIPWKDLYGSPVEATVDGLYILAQPNQEVKYNPKKEAENEYQTKLKEIIRVEEAKRKALETDKQKADPGFVEKLVTQIIKNVQIKISNIHIRYEDKVTNPGHPFSLGITLSSLLMQSTDDKWKPCIVKDATTKIYKIVDLQALAVYWNTNTEVFNNLTPEDKCKKLIENIANKTDLPKNFYYILGPINASTRVRLNPKPEDDRPKFSIPKLHANLDMEKLALGITKSQYQDIIALADSMNLMLTGLPYRKYRPHVKGYKGHYKEWWKFAYTCILETEVRRKKKNWDWNHIITHRSDCKEYGQLYQQKLTNKKLEPDLEKKITFLEHRLDVTNLVIIRQKIELEVEKLGKQQEEVSKKTWFGSWWGGATKADTELSSKTELLKKFEEAMTPAEKSKLYKAIDYQENSAPAEYPLSFIDATCTFLLRHLEIKIFDDTDRNTCVVAANLEAVKCRLDRRPAKNGIKVAVNISKFDVHGVEQDDFKPQIISCEECHSSELLEIVFEMNPIDKSCGQSIFLKSNPLKIIYDSETINKAIGVFELPKSSTLEQLSVAAGQGINNFKEMSSLGLQYAISQHSHLLLDINLKAPYIIIPYGGKYLGSENVLVANLGTLKISTKERQMTAIDVKKKHAQGTDEKKILEEMIEQSYDNFIVNFVGLQLILAQSGEDWSGAIQSLKRTKLHLLFPLNLEINVNKCLIQDDPRLPLMKIRGQLQSLSLSVSDVQLIQIFSLVNSIPLPNSEPEPIMGKMTKTVSTLSIPNVLDINIKNAQKSDKPKEMSLVQFTKMDVKFVMKELALTLGKYNYDTEIVEDLLRFKVSTFQLLFLQQTFNMDLRLSLESIGLDAFRLDNKPVNMISTPETPNKTSLFSVKFTQVNKRSPEFHTKYHSCESMLQLEFAKLNILCHQETLQDIMRLGNDLMSQISEISGSGELKDRASRTTRRLSSISENIHISASQNLKSRKLRSKHSIVQSIIFKLIAKLHAIKISLVSDKVSVAEFNITGMNCEVVVKKPYTQVVAILEGIGIKDLNPETKHPNILTVVGKEAVRVQCVLYNLDENDTSEVDMKIFANMGKLRIVYLNLFVSNVLDFLDQFQEAQAAIVEASHAAAENAKQNLQHAYEKAQRINLNIDMTAPDVIVPAASNSFNCLLLKMGRLTLVNHFKNIEGIKSEKGYSAVLDEMKMKLVEFEFIRVLFDNSYNQIHSTEMLKPVNVGFQIKRNLSKSWYNVVPDVDISGHIGTIETSLTEMDYSMIMAVLEKNLAEGQKPPKPDHKPEPKPTKTQFELMSKASKSIQSEVVSMMDEPKDEIEDNTVNTALKFSFTMERFILNLHKCPAINSAFPEVTEGLARFSLEGLSIKGNIFSDGTMSTALLLINCYLDDIRPERKGNITRMLERKQVVITEEGVKPIEENWVKSMIDVMVQVKKNDIFLDLKVYSLNIILSVDFLKSIAEFFTNYMDSINHLDLEAKHVNKTDIKKSIMSAKPTADVESVVSEVISSKHKSQPMITINFKVEQPDIVLIEKMDSIDSKALILHSEILMKLRLCGAHQVINGTVKDIQMYVCTYNPIYRLATKIVVLHPLSISAAGSTPEGKGLHLEVHFTDVKISISPAILELLNRIYITAFSVYDKNEDSKNEEVDYSNIWNTKKVTDADHWYLKAEYGFDALRSIKADTQLTTLAVLKELCLVSMPKIVITIEAGFGSKTLPLLLLDSTFKGSVKNWSSQISIDSSLSLQLGYYNCNLALWEPLIEQIEIQKETGPGYVPWELKFEMCMIEKDLDTSLQSPGDEPEEQSKNTSVIIDISSKNMLEITVTKSALEVFSNLSKAFTNAINATEEMKASELAAPYLLRNHTGVKLTVMLKDSPFRVYQAQSPLKEVVLNPNAEVPLEVILPKQLTEDRYTMFAKKTDLLLRVKINDLNTTLDLPVVKADKRYFPLNYKQNGDTWGMVSSIRLDDGIQFITLRSTLQIHNHFHIPVELYYMTARGNELESLTTIQPGNWYNVPFKAVYSPSNELFFSVDGYTVTNVPFIWKELQANLFTSKYLYCTPKDREQCEEPFVIKAVGVIEQIFFEHTNRHTMSSTSFHLHLRPAIILRNCLPLKLICCTQNVVEEKIVQPGESIDLPNINPGKSNLIIRIPEYLDKEWTSNYEISESPQTFSVWTFNSYDSVAKMALDLGMHNLEENGSVTMTLYCPFWMINKTELMLSYRKSRKTEKHEAAGSPAKSSDENLNILHHPPTYADPILFSFNAKNFFGKKKASVRVGQGEWSDKFSLDVAGSSGVVVCKSNNMIYQIGVQNQLSTNGLTKILTFLPYYVIINNSPYTIECQEFERPGDAWIVVEPKSCSSLWPRCEQEDKLLRLRVKGTDEISAGFLITESHTTLLKLKNKYGGINVDIQLTEGAIYINLTDYQPGFAPALIVNHTRDTLRLWEKENVQIRKLEPYHSLLFTWDNPMGSRVLCWDIGNNKDMEDELRKDDLREFSPREGEIVYWLSFLDGMQRVVLFTEDPVVAEEAQSTKQFEEQSQEINVSIYGIGLSLVNNMIQREIMYIGIASTGVIWEQSKSLSRRYKQLSTKDSINFEIAYQQYLEKKHVSTEDFGRAIIDNKTEVDFESNTMLKPHKRFIRRTFQTGLWIQMKSSVHQMQLHAKINRLQIDNQIYDCIFPVVLAPVPPPKSVAMRGCHKPFVELSIVQLLIKNSQIKQYKYFKVLVQEFHVKVDLGFINAVLELVQPSDGSKDEEKTAFIADMESVKQPLFALVSSQSIQEQKSFYDLLHFSPLKIHVSFSLASSGTTTTTLARTPNFMSVLLQGLGVTLTDMQDVVFKLAYFERVYTFLTQKQLVSEATQHYVGQSVKQLYVLVFGLDVLGNPYGLVIGISKGVNDLFYEPFQGAIQGPGEFAEGLVLGVRSLFGHTVGGAAGAVSRITGAMGKGIAALTFDKDFQRKRRDQMNKKPANVQEGIARGGKGLVMGVVDGVTGVFTKPISGAKEEGFEGFFKGLGKGAIGLVTRPTAGVIDFASGSFDAVKRVTEVGSEETTRLRAPRFLHVDKVVRPYSYKDAEGHKILHELEKGKYYNTDVYAYHVPIIEKKEVLLLTDKRLAYITHNDLFGTWQMDWSYTWQEIKSPATVNPKGVSIAISEPKKKKLGLFGSSDSGKVILIADPQLREEVCQKIESLRHSA